MTTEAQQRQHDKRWIILVAIGIAQLMVVLDATIVNIALPSAQQDLGFGNDDRQWVITAYALAFGSLLLVGGRIGDLFGRKLVFIAGLLGFAVASAIGGAAQSFGMLIGARALQGLFGAILAPAALGLLTTAFTDPAERAKAFGIFGALAGGGAAIGLLLGGILTEVLDWRWCLYVNLLFAIPAALMGLRLLAPAQRNPEVQIDWPGTFTAVLGLLALVYGFAEVPSRGWGDPVVVACLIAAVVLLGTFITLQTRVAHPLLPLRIVRDKARGGSYLSIALVSMGVFSVFLFLTFFLQQNLGFTPIQTGLAFLPMNFAIIFTATVLGPRLLPKLGVRPLVVAGMVLGGIGMLYLAQLDDSSTYAAHVLPALIVLGLGLGNIFSAAIQTATLGIEPRDAGVGSAMVNTGQQVGGSIGTALLSTLAASSTTGYLADQGGRPTGQVVAAAQVHGYTTGFYWAAAIFLVGAVICGLILPPKLTETAPAGDPVVAH